MNNIKHAKLNEFLEIANIETVLKAVMPERIRQDNARILVLCPFHKDRHFGSCVIYKNRLKCWSCGKSYSILETCAQYWGYSLNTFKDKCDIADRICSICYPELLKYTFRELAQGTTGTAVDSIDFDEIRLVKEHLKILGFDMNDQVHSIIGSADDAYSVKHPEDATGDINWYDVPVSKIVPNPDGQGVLCFKTQQYGLMNLYAEDPRAFADIIIPRAMIIVDKSRENIQIYQEVLQEYPLSENARYLVTELVNVLQEKVSAANRLMNLIVEREELLQVDEKDLLERSSA